MRCVESCNYREMPNNMPRLKNHIEHCSHCVPADGVNVVWEDGELVAVREVEGGAVKVAVEFYVHEDPEIPKPVEAATPPATTVTALKKRSKKSREESNEF